MKIGNIKSLKWISTFVLVAILSFSISCTSKKKVIDDDFAVDSAEAGFSEADLVVDGEPDASIDIADGTEAVNGDEFSDFSETEDSAASIENELNNISDDTTTAQETAPEEVPPPAVAESQPENPVDIVEVEPPATPAPIDSSVAEAPITETPIAESPITEDVTPEATPAPVVSKVNNIQYKGNDNGGTVIISSDHPLNYTTRINSTNNQVVVEVQDVVVADRLKRPLNTKDMSSSIGHVDVYQKKDSNVARFVVQLRPNSPEPLVQPEGNSLLIIGSAIDGSGPNPKQDTVLADNSSNGESSEQTPASGLMSSDDLEEFLASNNKYYGKPISIETADMDVRDILKLISEESGVNMVFDDDITGRSTLKLRKVPWDQALVTLLKSKKFGYRRQGSILRIARIDTLVKEDMDAVKLKESKATVEPLVVRNFMINYAEVEKLESKIKEYIADGRRDATNRGRVTSDSRTNTLIVTETESKLEQVAQLIKALDTQPQQVMIEARVIEATDNYARSIGGNIGFNRTPTSTIPPIAPGTTAPPNFTTGPVTTPTGSNYWGPSLSLGPGTTAGSSFLGNIFFGTLGAFGNLDAQLALDETEGRVKILSSPRVAVLTNTSATINQGATIMVRNSTTTATTTGATTDSFTPVQVGVKLNVTPQVSNIGTVKLKLSVSRTAPTAGSNDGGTTDRNVNTEIIVKSGDTAVVGGVFQSDMNYSVKGVPGLKDIPILGTLFKNETKSNQKTELMIFVTPKIIPLLNQMLKADSGSGDPVQ